jgi:hypothetical protein
VKAERYSGTPAEPAIRRRSREARERRLGEIPAKVFTGLPWKSQTHGRLQQPSGLNTRATARDSGKGQSPGAAAYRAGPALRWREHR